jgi:hypothetical protein
VSGLPDLFRALTEAGFGYEMQTVDGEVEAHHLHITSPEFSLSISGDRDHVIYTTLMLLPDLRDGAPMLKGQVPEE